MPQFVLIAFLLGSTFAHAEECPLFSPSENQLFMAAKIPAPLREKNFDSFEPHNLAQSHTVRMLHKLIEFNEPRTAGLFVQGQPGTGKTHLAISFAKSMLAKGHKVLYLNSQNIANLSTYLLVRKQGYPRLASYDALIIDNIPIQSRHPFGAQILKEAIDLRKTTTRKKILLVSSESAEQILADIDPLGRNAAIREEFHQLFRSKQSLQ